MLYLLILLGKQMFWKNLASAKRWDLVNVDEAHKLAAYRGGQKLDRTRRYRLGEFLTVHTEHSVIMGVSLPLIIAMNGKGI
jgi:hypothetical protein